MNRRQQAAKLAEDLEVTVEELERAIIEISAAMKRLDSMRLQRKAIVVLIASNSGLSKGTISIVLNNLDDLERVWLKTRRT